GSSHSGAVAKRVEGRRGRGGGLFLLVLFLALLLHLLRPRDLLLLLTRETSKQVLSAGLEGVLTFSAAKYQLDLGYGSARDGRRSCSRGGAEGNGGCSSWDGRRSGSCSNSGSSLLLTHHTVHPHADASLLGADVGDEVVLGTTITVLVLLGDGSSDVEGSGGDEIRADVDLLRQIDVATTEENTAEI
ncbi:hypothetical protein PFISCL1PPCAC_8233, partial [Pristionchus fissidentatus]